MKRGMSNIVATVLVILLALVSVTIISIYVNSITKKSLDDAPSLDQYILNFEIPFSSVFVNHTSKQVNFIIERKAGEGDLQGFIIVLEDNFGTTQTNRDYEHTVVRELETLRVRFTHTLAGNITKITVAPVMISRSGDPIIGRPISTIPVNSRGGAGGGGGPGDQGGPGPDPQVQCNDGIDNEDPEDTLIDVADPGCVDIQDNNETDDIPIYICSNGEDDDEDGFIDYPADPGCTSATDNSEFDTLTDPALITYITFDSSSRQGNYYVDQGPRGNNLMAATIASGQGMLNEGGRFNGQNQFGNYTNYTPFDFRTTDFTVGVWFKADQINKNDHTIIGRGIEPGGPTPYGGFKLYIEEGKLLFRISDNQTFAQGNKYYWTIIAGIEENRWYHTVITRVGSEMRLYLNGELSKSISIPANYQVRVVAGQTPAPVGVGSHLYVPGSPRDLFNGTMDDLIVWNRSLSTVEIGEWYDGYGVPRGIPVACHDYDFLWGVAGFPINSSWHALYTSNIPAIEHQRYTLIGPTLGHRGLPHYNSSGSPINGGIPQRANSTLFCDEVKAEIDYRLSIGEIPSPSFTGLAIIDLEAWRPLWEWENNTIYGTQSRLNVSQEHPEWNATQIEAEAQRRFEEGARNIFLLGITCTRERLANAQIGYYAFPGNYHTSVGYSTTNRDYLRGLNDRLSWLWQAVDVITPDIYISYKSDYFDQTTMGLYYTPESKLQETQAGNEQFAINGLRESVRISNAYGNKPIYPFTWYRYHDQSQQPYAADISSMIDFLIESETPYEEYTDGIILWGYETYTGWVVQGNPDPDPWTSVGPFFRDQAGPEIQRIKARSC